MYVDTLIIKVSHVKCKEANLVSKLWTLYIHAYTCMLFIKDDMYKI